MKLAFWLLILAFTGFVYFWWVRPYLKTLPTFTELWVEEDRFWKALKEWVLGRRTILIGIWGEFIIWLPDLLQSLNIIDIATALGWDDAKKAVANIFLTLAMLVFRAKASDR